MRIRALALVLALSISSAVGAQAAPQTTHPVVWEGEIFLDSVSSACAAANWAQFNDFTSVYRPKFSTATYTHNGKPEGLSIVTHRGDFLVTSASTSGSLHGGTASVPVAGYGIGSRAAIDQWTGDAALTISPYPVSASTPVVTITGTLTNFSDVTGCTISFTGAYVERLD